MFAVDVVLLALALIVALLTVPPSSAPRHDGGRPSIGALAGAAPLLSPSSASPCFSSRSPGCCRPIWSSVAGSRWPRPDGSSPLPPPWALRAVSSRAGSCGAAFRPAVSPRSGWSLRRWSPPLLRRSAARAARRRRLRAIVRAGRTGAGGGLRLGAAGRRERSRDRTDQRPAGAGGQPGIAGRAAAAGAVGGGGQAGRRRRCC